MSASYAKKLFSKRGKGKARPRRPMGDYTLVKKQKASAPPNLGEMKHFDDGINIISDAIWVWDPLTTASIRNGTTSNTRIGSRITITRVSFRGYYRLDDAHTIGEPEIVRVALFVDHMNTGANPVYSTWFQENSIWSHRSIIVPPRGSILHDEVFELHATIAAAAGATNPLHYVQFTIPCNIEVNFSADTGQVTDNRGNVLFLGVCSFNYAGASEGRLIGNLRVAYRD